LLFTATLIRSLLLAVVVVVAFIAAVFSNSAASSRNSKTGKGGNSLSMPGSKPEKLIENSPPSVLETQQVLTVTSEVALTRVE